MLYHQDERQLLEKHQSNLFIAKWYFFISAIVVACSATVMITSPDMWWRAIAFLVFVVSGIYLGSYAVRLIKLDSIVRTLHRRSQHNDRQFSVTLEILERYANNVGKQTEQ